MVMGFCFRIDNKVKNDNQMRIFKNLTLDQASLKDRMIRKHFK